MEAVDIQLEEALRTVDVLEPVGAELPDRDAVGLVVDELARGVRQHDLPAVPDGSDPSGAMHPEADVPFLPDDWLSGVQSHSHTDLLTLRPGMFRERALGDDGGTQSRIRACESEEERVPLRVDLAAAPLGGGLADDALVFRESIAVARSEPLQQLGRAFDVGEEKGDRAARQFRHSRPFARSPIPILRPHGDGETTGRPYSMAGSSDSHGVR
ncbi:MAG: hypothetical protein M3546_15620 [Actinomycetota bacterium]|nr:hypothetical protein [Actinomycetota bacterium]